MTRTRCITVLKGTFWPGDLTAPDGRPQIIIDASAAVPDAWYRPGWHPAVLLPVGDGAALGCWPYSFLGVAARPE